MPAGALWPRRVWVQRPQPDYAGGGVTHAERLTEALQHQGIDARLQFGPAPAEALDAVDLVHLFHTPKRAELVAMLRIARVRGARIALTTIYWHDAPLHAYARSLGYAAPDSPRARLQETLDRARLAFLVRSADLLFPASRTEAAFLQQDFGVTPERCLAVPPGVEARFADAQPEAFVDQYAVRDFIFCPGAIGPVKNQLTLLAALRDLPRPVLLAGPVVHPDYLQRCRRAAGPSVRIINTIPADLMPSAYAAAAVTVVPSWRETFSLVTLEALAAGCPVALTRSAGAQDALAGAVTPCDPANAESIRRAVETAAADTVPDAIRARIAREFSWERIARQTADAYAQLAHLTPRPLDEAALAALDDATALEVAPGASAGAMAAAAAALARALPSTAAVG